jgi:hypothetical protein
VPSQFGDRAGQFDVCRAAAADQEGQQPFALDRVVGGFGALEGGENAGAYRLRVIDGF